MAVVHATGPILAGTAASADYRPRTPPGHTAAPRDGTVGARKAAPPADQKPREHQRRRASADENDLPAGAMFAASLAAAALPPERQSHEELAQRLDSLRVQEDSSPRMPDRLA